MGISVKEKPAAVAATLTPVGRLSRGMQFLHDFGHVRRQGKLVRFLPYGR